MEDPKRIRTKLRLDLQDVRKQIEDLEELLQKDNSAENVEAHRKLVEYEKKLKQEYEKISGLSVDQATRLEGKVKHEGQKKKSRLSGFFGILATAGIFIGVYHTILHSIIGYDPQAIIDYFAGTGGSENFTVFTNHMTDGTFLYIVVIPLVAGGLLSFISTLLDKNRKGIINFFEGGSLMLFGIYLGGIVYVGEQKLWDDQTLHDIMLNYFGIMVGLLIACAFFFLIGGLTYKGGLKKFLGFGTAAFFAAAAAQAAQYIPSEHLAYNLVVTWPWIYIMVMAAMLFQFFIYLIKLFGK